MSKSTLRRMYAVAKDGFVSPGTAAYSRRTAICLFTNGNYGGYDREAWKELQHAGYRTVRLTVAIEE